MLLSPRPKPEDRHKNTRPNWPHKNAADDVVYRRAVSEPPMSCAKLGKQPSSSIRASIP